MKRYLWLILWAIASIGVAVVLQVLFYIDAPIPLLEAKWNAGEILTYISTVMLGLLALWQNQKYKEESDKAQNKMEKLSNRANELQITVKLIEHETERINLLRNLFNEFVSACSCNHLVADYRKPSKDERPYAYYSILRSEQIQTSYQMLIQQLNIDKDCDSLAKAISQTSEKLYASAMGIMLSLTISQEDEWTEEDTKKTKSQMEKQLQIEKALRNQFNQYLTDMEKGRNALIFENYTLDELQRMYQRKELYQEKQ